MSPRVPVLALALLLITSGPVLAAERQLTVDDVLRLHWAGVSEEVIISEIIVTESVFELRVDELLRLQEAGLSDRLIQFMVDTGLPAEDRLPADEYEETAVDGETGWINVIEEDPEPEVVYNVSLRYQYPTWWYGNYWYDYWYYDCHYAPYRSNWSFSIGAWYPGWYGYGGIWVWPGCGYRNYCGWYGSYPYGSHYYDPGYYYGGHPSGGAGHELSSVKYKSNGGSGAIASAASSRDLGLKMRDGRTVTRKSADLDRPPGRRQAATGLAVAGAGGGRRPARHVSNTSAPGMDERRTRQPTGGLAVADGRRTRPTRPSRAVRQPATDVRPPRKVYTRGSRTSGVSEGGGRKPPRKKSPGVSPPQKTPTKVRRSSPAPSPAPSSVRSSPPRQAPRSAPATRSAPRSSAPRSKATRSGGGKRR